MEILIAIIVLIVLVGVIVILMSGNTSPKDKNATPMDNYTSFIDDVSSPPIVNYTQEQTDILVSAYTKADDQESRDAVVEKIANEFGKKPASIKAKLSALGVYVPKVYVSKYGVLSVRKSELVDTIAVLWGVQTEAIETLVKANKHVIELVLDKAQMRVGASTINLEKSGHDTGGVILSTQARVDIIAVLLGIPVEMIESLKKASKGPIKKSLDSAQAFIGDYTEVRNEDDRDAVIEEYAEKFDLSTDSIRALLPREESYVAKTHPAEQNDVPSSKDALIEEIAANWRIDPEEIDTLAKADKRVIRHVLEDSQKFSRVASSMADTDK